MFGTMSTLKAGKGQFKCQSSHHYNDNLTHYLDNHFLRSHSNIHICMFVLHQYTVLHVGMGWGHRDHLQLQHRNIPKF